MIPKFLPEQNIFIYKCGILVERTINEAIVHYTKGQVWVRYRLTVPLVGGGFIISDEYSESEVFASKQDFISRMQEINK